MMGPSSATSFPREAISEGCRPGSDSLESASECLAYGRVGEVRYRSGMTTELGCRSAKDLLPRLEGQDSKEGV